MWLVQFGVNRYHKEILREHELNGCIAAKKPAWTKKYLMVRLSCDGDVWNNIIFSDKVWMELHSNKRTFVRRPSGKRNDPRYIMKREKFGCKRLMLWGKIISDGSRKLVKIYSNLNSSKCIQLLKDNLIPGLGEGEIFQHSEVPCHRSRTTRQSLADEGITALKDGLLRALIWISRKCRQC